MFLYLILYVMNMLVYFNNKFFLFLFLVLYLVDWGILVIGFIFVICFLLNLNIFLLFKKIIVVIYFMKR